MKKILFILALSMALVMCKTSKTAAAKTTKAKPEVAYNDNFKAAPEAEKTATLKALKATGETQGVLILTKNFKGENITISSAAKKFYTGYPISNMGNGLAEKIAIDNTADITIYDNHTKKEAVIKASDSKKYKFVYVEKKPGGKNPFAITYSNKLAKFE